MIGFTEVLVVSHNSSRKTNKAAILPQIFQQYQKILTLLRILPPIIWLSLLLFLLLFYSSEHTVTRYSGRINLSLPAFLSSSDKICC
jgi:hypothetical protein